MRQGLPACLILLLLSAFSAGPAASQSCRGHADLREAEVCLLDQVEVLRLEVEESFDRYMELLPSLEARGARASHDRWERYLDEECQDAGDRYQGGAPVLVEILSCQEWGTRQRAFQLRLLLAALRGGDFVYDPSCFVPVSDLVVLSGSLAQRPTGEFESITLLTLDHPLCTDLGSGPQVVTAVQLVGFSPGLGRRIHRTYGTRARVEGRLFLPHLPFHKTPLVLVVQSVDPEP